ncbi:MAG: hypothetical protein JW940_19755 [Polyangiaceae bacterium]|nr:hypothetical protein [Polyangiaceae bacterium]
MRSIPPLSRLPAEAVPVVLGPVRPGGLCEGRPAGHSAIANGAPLGDSLGVTPVLQDAYDALVTKAAQPPFAERAQELRRQFHERCGRYDSNHPQAELREIAAWEDALVRGGLAGVAGGSLEDPQQRKLARAFTSAVRGVFVFTVEAGHVIAQDLWSRAPLLVLDVDATGRALVPSDPATGTPPCQARLLPTLDGCTVLPGVVFHPADALTAIDHTLEVARERALDTDSVLDALLSMEHRWQTMSRVKVAYAYRAEFLPTG